ncbi:dynein light chain Tctex-type 5-B-like isoform X1 [Embiotoca jacksoni]|uniref:dynein light chain Tctex-type 5-B-like isoform X1 n=1 Tax=Embiotoca jacksoni TaxID=100190 RepID=UPI003704C66C
MSDILKDKLSRKEKRIGRMSIEGSHGSRGTIGKTKDSVCAMLCIEEAGHHDDHAQMGVKMENSYQMGPGKRFPVPAVTDILNEVLTSFLKEKKSNIRSQKMSSEITEEIKDRVKELMIPRYKIVVLVYVGQFTGQSMQISSRCQWDAANDTFAYSSFKNNSLFSVASVYAVYAE